MSSNKVTKTTLNETEQTANEASETKPTKIAKKDLVLPKGTVFLFSLAKLDYITFEAHEYEFNNGKLVNILSVGKDTISVLKHKLHRKIYERSTERSTGTDESDNDSKSN